MRSFSLFLSSLWMLFLGTTTCVSGLKSHITSCPLALTLSFRFTKSATLGVLLWIWHRQQTVRYNGTQAFFPFSWSWQDCLHFESFFYLSVSYLLFHPSFPPLTAFHGLCFKEVSWVSMLLVQAEFTVAKRVPLWELQPFTLPSPVHPLLPIGWSPASASQAYQSSPPHSWTPNPSLSLGPLLTSCRGD